MNDIYLSIPSKFARICTVCRLPSTAHRKMLAIPLPQLKRQLEELLLDIQHLATALKQLRDLLPEHSEKRVTVLTLLGRLNDSNKKALRGTLDNSALQTEYNAIRSDLIDLVAGLEELDFDEQAGKKSGPASAKASAGKQGNVLYRIPHIMPLHQETECVVRIAVHEDAIVEEITIDTQVVLKDLARISDLMQVELADPAKTAVFSIRSTSAPQQLITEEGFTQWIFYVEPLQMGTHQLEVKVSVLELAFNQVHRKELVFRETIQIITEGAAAAEDTEEMEPYIQHASDFKVKNTAPPAPPESPYFKSAGQAFAFDGQLEPNDFSPIQPNQGVTPPPPSPNRSNGNLRTLALFLAFILLGSTATWAFTPAETRDWWVASIIQDDAPAYAAYIEKHPQSPYLEKAVFYRAERSDNLADFRTYQQTFRDGKFQDKVIARIGALETKAIDNIRQRPSPDNIQQFATQFPESERLSELKQVAEARTDNRKELLTAVEDAYVASARKKPTEKKITDYLRDFPRHDRLNDMAAVAAAQPDVLAKVQPAMEAAITRKVQAATTPDEVRNVLPALETAGNTNTADKVEKMVAQNPQFKKQSKLQQEVRQSSERVREREHAAIKPTVETGDLKAENRDWAAAEKANTARGYIYFAKKHPNSTYETEARSRINNFNLTLKERKLLELEAVRRLKQEN